MSYLWTLAYGKGSLTRPIQAGLHPEIYPMAAAAASRILAHTQVA